MTARTGPRGVTLVECLIASTILAAAVIAISQSVVAGQMANVQALHNQRAVMLAEALAEEVISLPYNEPDGVQTLGPDAGEMMGVRSTFDNVDDYHGFIEVEDAITDVYGTLYPETYQQFSRRVEVSYTTLDVAGLPLSMSGIVVTVYVTDQDGREWNVTRFVPEPD